MRPQRKLSCYLNLQHLHSAEQNFLDTMKMAAQKIRDAHTRQDQKIENLFKRLALVGSLNDQLEAVMNAWQWGADTPESTHMVRQTSNADSRLDLAQIVRAEEEQFCQFVQLAIQQIQAVPAEDEPNFNNHFLLRYMVIGWLTVQTEASLSVWNEPPSPMSEPTVRRNGDQPTQVPQEPPTASHDNLHRIRYQKATMANVTRGGFHNERGADNYLRDATVAGHGRRLSSSSMEIAGHKLPRSLPTFEPEHRHHTTYSVDSTRRPLKRSRNDDSGTEQRKNTTRSEQVQGTSVAALAFLPPPPLPVPAKSPGRARGPTSPMSLPHQRESQLVISTSPNSTTSSECTTSGSQHPSISSENGSIPSQRSTELTVEENTARTAKPMMPVPASKVDPKVCKFAYPYASRGVRSDGPDKDSSSLPSVQNVQRTDGSPQRCHYESDDSAANTSKQMAVDSPPPRSPSIAG